MKLELVDDFRSAWRWFSVQAMFFAAVIIGAWAELPASLRDALPEGADRWVALTVLALGIVGRTVKQPERKP